MGEGKVLAYCTLADDAGIFASTPLSNLFIQEYMGTAPGDYVKVYLYGLMQSIYPSTAEPTLQKFAAALRMDVAAVEKAFAYWQAKGLLREQTGKKGREGFEYLDVHNVMFEGRVTLAESRIFEHNELSNAVAAASGGYRLSSGDYDLLYDLYDVDHFEDEAIVQLVAFCVQTFGKKLNSTRLASVAREWKAKGINTGEKAKEYVLGIEVRNSPANRILQALGITYRNVSEAEHRLFCKWSQEWHFSVDAILQACEGNTGVQNPNFKYLDKVLKGLFERGLNTAKKIKDGRDVAKAVDEHVQKCKHRLGLPGMVSEEQRNYYTRWRQSYGLSEEMVLRVCDEASAVGNASFKGVESLISSYVRRNLKTPADIERDQALTEDARRVFNAAGVSRAPTETDKAQIAAWQEKLPFEVILMAAEYAKDAVRPMGYLTRVLGQWQQQGICTLEQARAARQVHQQKAGPGAKGGTAQGKLHYQDERVYAQDELDALLDDLSTAGGE